MRYLAAIGVALSLGCISAAEAPSNYQTYSGIRVDSDPVLLARYDRALSYCQPEAMSHRGSPDTHSMIYNVALRNCLYRRSFVDRGYYAYPANQVFDHFLDR
ncbi:MULTISPECIES: hypothetical protein [unclassified Rhizobium]|jgi:hypothetical protein|uniref:hypothetical protein n=1 Tax=unclassified Rhizobium TaxID=2613769 RepID=UPI000DD66D86|nr:hypothetical protein [Rhizobium sp. BG4]QRM41989.1 hypothetical protein F2982_00245 [Rhizobium sp. BG4]